MKDIKCRYLFSGILMIFLIFGGIFLFLAQEQAKAELVHKQAVEISEMNMQADKPFYTEGEVLVTFKEEKVNLKEDKGLDKLDKLEQKKELAHLEDQDIKEKNIAVLKSDEKLTWELMNDLEKSSVVESVQPNYLYYPQAQTVPWGVDDTAGVKAQTANTNGYTGTGVIVAVIDTGVFHTHTDLDGNMWSPAGDNCYIDSVLTAGGCPNHGYDFGNGDNDPTEAAADSHGTHVAGTIAAEDNDADVVGVAPDATIMAINAINPVSGAASTNSIVRAVDFAEDNGADIINMSLGHYHPETLGDADDVLRQAIASATTAGILSVVATGNDALSIYGYPAAYPDVLAVGAVQEEDSGINPQEDIETRLAYFSCYGRTDIVGPGVNINSTTGDGATSGDTWSGTSMATPHVAGVAALVKQKYPAATPAEIIQILKSTAVDLGEAGTDMYFGSGLVDAEAATGVLSDSVVVEANWVEDNSTDFPIQYLPRVPADGTSTTKIRVTVSDTSGSLISGETVGFTSTLGTLSGTTAVTDSNGQATITLTASELAGTATVTATSNNYGGASVSVDFVSILLVSDAGEPYRYATSNTMSWFYTQTLEREGYKFARYETYHRDSNDWATWDIVVDNTPSLEYLQKFDLVIWYVGDWPLYNQDIIKEYLDGGGNIILSGQDFAYYFDAGSVTDNGLFATSLDATYSSDGVATDNTVTGLDILAGENIDLVSRYSGYGFYYGATGLAGNLWPDHIAVGSDAVAIGEYTSGAADAGLRYYNDTYRVIYLPFSFDAIYFDAERRYVYNLLQQSILPLASVSDAVVKSTSNNDESKINALSEDDVDIKVTFDETPIHGAVYVSISDGTNTVTKYAAADTSDAVTAVEGLDASGLDEGTITVSAAHVYDITNPGTLTEGTDAYKNSVLNKPENLRTPTKKRKARTVRMKWDEVAGADYYKVQVKTKSGKKVATFKNVSKTYKDLKKKYTKTNKAYKFRTKACIDNVGCGSYANYDNFRTLPAQVKSLNLYDPTSTSFYIKWKKVRAPKKITYRVKLMDKSKKKIAAYSTKKRKTAISGLTAGITYKIKVRAKYKNKASQAGKWSQVKKIVL